MEKVSVKIKLVHPDAKMPLYGSDEAAGIDLYSVEEKIIEPNKLAVIGTGVAMEIQKGYCWQFWDRSGMGIKGIHHFAGLGDSDYRGEFKVILFNSSSVPYKIEKGDRIVQVVIVPIVKAELTIVDELSKTNRGDGGFHSTGKR